MNLFELFEASEPAYHTLVVFPGRFQPPHKGHMQVYKHLAKQYGQDNVFIATSSKVEPPRSPFNFQEKKALLTLAGVPSDHIIETKSPYIARELTEHYDPSSTVLIFAVSAKDMAEDPRFSFQPKKDGSPSYFQPLKKGQALQPFSKHAYITTIPTFKFEINGQAVNSATQIRAMFANGDEETQKSVFQQLYGRFDPKLFDLVKNKLSPQVEEGKIGNAIKKAGAIAGMATAAFAANPQIAAAHTELPMNKIEARYIQTRRKDEISHLRKMGELNKRAIDDESKDNVRR